MGQASNNGPELVGQGGLEGVSLLHRRIRTVVGLDDHTGIELAVTWTPRVGIRNLFAL